MKYGEQFEKESVPQWSLHNIDYNSLKHHIKAHTTRDQATAIAIPGRPNTALHKFEDDFYAELCRQHDRVELFVSSKADEIARRLQHLSSQIHRLILRCATSGRNRMSLKRRQRFARYEQVLLQCGDDIKSLQRFVNAQVVAFRKILKKYRKWTGSSTLGARFRDILSHPKSFTKRDFAQLQSHHDDLLQTLHAALPAGGVGLPEPESQLSRPPSVQLSPSETVVDPESQPAAGYWNEYEYGSEAGDFDRNGDDQYAIYIDPNQDNSFPGLKTLGVFLSRPITKLTAWISFHPESDSPTTDLERGPLLPIHATDGGYGATSTPPGLSYLSSPHGGTNTNTTDTDVDDDRTASSRQASNGHSRRGSLNRGYTSSSDDQMFFPSGYSTHYAAALPSIEDQRVVRYRERVLRWGTWACYGIAFVLMGIAAVLIVAGRQKMRLEVDAGVILGIMASLGLACGGLCMTSSRTDKLGLVGRLAVWSAFVVVCVADGVLLVLLMGNARI